VRAEEDLAWDLAQQMSPLAGHSDEVWDARWSPDGTRIATNSLDGTARIWDAITGEQLLTIELGGRGYYLDWSPDGTRIVTTGAHGPAQVWDVITGELIFEVARPPEHRTVTVGWSPDGSRIAVVSIPDMAVIIVDAASGEIVATAVEGEWCRPRLPSWSPAGDMFASGAACYFDYASPGYIFDATTGKVLRMLPRYDGWTITAAWSPDGKRIVATHAYDDEFVGSRARTVNVWQISAGAAGGALIAEETLTYDGHGADVWAVAWSPDGERIATGDGDGVVYVWDATTGIEFYSFRAPGMVDIVDWSPDGTGLLVAGEFDIPLVLRIWESTEELITHARDCCVTRELSPAERDRFGLPPRRSEE
jgi:WD40 repeat protein